MSAHGLIAGTLAAAMILAWLIVLGAASPTETSVGAVSTTNPPTWRSLAVEAAVAAVFTVLFFGWVLQ